MERAKPSTESRPRFYFLRTGDRSVVYNGKPVPFVKIGDDLSYYITEDQQLADGLRQAYIKRLLAGVEEVTREVWAEKKRMAIERQFERDRSSQQPLNQVRLQGKVDPFVGSARPAANVAGVRPRLSTVVPDPKNPTQEKIARDTAHVVVPPPTSAVPKAELIAPAGPSDVVAGPPGPLPAPSVPLPKPPPAPPKGQKTGKVPAKAVVKAVDDEF